MSPSRCSLIQQLAADTVPACVQEIDPTPDDSSVEALDGSAGGFLNELASAIPGIDEAMSFAEVMKQVRKCCAGPSCRPACFAKTDHRLHTMQVQSLDYSCIIFDTAPTGHTLRLLQFPTTLEKGLNKLMSLRGAFGGIMSQV